MSNLDVDCTGVKGGTPAVEQPTPITTFNLPSQKTTTPAAQPASSLQIANPFTGTNAIVIVSAVIAIAAIAGVGYLVYKM